MRDHFEAKEFGVVGEFAVPARQPPPPPLPQPLRPPAPDWNLEAQEREARERAEEVARAREVLKQNDPAPKARALRKGGGMVSP